MKKFLFSIMMLVGFLPISAHAQENSPLDYWFWQTATLEDVVKALDQGADINAHGDDRGTPLHWAAAYRTPEMVALLLDRGADIEARYEYGKTPLHAAAAYGKTPEIIVLLLDRGADAGARDGIGKSPLDYAKRNKNLQGTEALEKLIVKAQVGASPTTGGFSDFPIGILAFVILFAVIFFYTRSRKKKLYFKEKIESKFPQAKIHFSHHNLYDQINNDTSFLVVVFERKQIIVGLEEDRISPPEKAYKISIAFADIVKAEIVRDNTQVATTNRGSQLLGAAVGAVALGGVGAVIGGLSASSTTLSGAKHIAIRITVNDTNKPIHEVTFYASRDKKGGKQGELIFDQAVRKAAEFGAYLDAAIRETEKEQSEQIEAGQGTPVSEQISQLWELKEKGALTQEEFEKQKARLLES